MSGRNIISLVGERQDIDHFRRKNWTGTFEEYLDIVRDTPQCTRNAFERVYDMILSYGTSTYQENREKRVHYHFFDDPDNEGADAVFGWIGDCRSWSMPSRVRPRATESRNACCCCMVRSAAARARLPDC